MNNVLTPPDKELFNKIKLYEKLEIVLIKVYKERYGKEIKNIINNNEPNFPVEENKSTYKKIKQISFLNEVFNKYHKDAVDIASSLYSEQGALCGEDAKSKYPVYTAPDIYKALNDYILTDKDIISESKEYLFEWKNYKSIDENYEKIMGNNIDILYNLKHLWIKSFVQSSNKNYMYNVISLNEKKDYIFFHQIKKQM